MGFNSLSYLYFTFQLAIFTVYFIASYNFFLYFFLSFIMDKEIQFCILYLKDEICF